MEALVSQGKDCRLRPVSRQDPKPRSSTFHAAIVTLGPVMPYPTAIWLVRCASLFLANTPGIDDMSSSGSSENGDYVSRDDEESEKRYPLHDCCEFEDIQALKVR
jgi:hypothetical protein